MTYVLGETAMHHHEGRLTGAGGLELYYQSWFPTRELKAVLGIVHGLGSHSSCFSRLVKVLVSLGYGVYGLDLRGHGRSPGPRGYVQNWAEFRQDLACFHRLIREERPHQACYVIGHSLGANVVLDYALAAPEKLAGIIAIAPVVGPVGISPLKLALGRLLSRLWPRFTLNAGIPEGAGSHDPTVIAAYVNDPLRHTKGTARLATEFLRNAQQLRTRLCSLQTPLLVLQGGEDVVALPAGSRALFNRLPLMDKEYQEYPHGYHDLHNDTCYQQVALDISNWINAHINGKAPKCELSHSYPLKS